jgi:FkbM family methyltransferase
MMGIPEMFRPLLRILPFDIGKGRLASMVDINEIPAGAVTRMKSGVAIKLYADPMYVRPYLYGEYEVQLTKVIQRMVRPGDTCLDVGANFGYYTALLAKLVGPAGAVHAFEPLPSFHAMATETISLNSAVSNVSVHNLGLGRAAGSFTVYTFSGLPQGHASSNSLDRTDAVPHLCFVNTLDEFVVQKGINRLDFMKVDVEGDELNVFLGGERTLSVANAPAIAFEINPTCLSKRGLSPSSVKRALENFGYSIFYSIPARGRLQQVSTFPNEYFDYLALKENHLSRFKGNSNF